MPPSQNKKQRFPDTRWSLVDLAGSTSDVAQSDAMMELLQIYMPAMKAFLLGSKCVPVDSVDDLVHEFIEKRMMNRKLVVLADKTKGRFRNYLAKALSNFVATKMRREANMRARTSDQDVAELEDLRFAESEYRYDQEWTRLVVQDAISLMREDCARSDRADLWTVFSIRVVDPLLHGSDTVSYEDLVGRLGVETPRQAINLLVTAKRRFMKHLRSAVGRYAHGEDQIDNELASLREIIQS